MHGSRWSLGTVVVAASLILSIGVTVGAIAGYYGGFIDDLLMRVVDVLLGQFTEHKCVHLSSPTRSLR
jgi:peptide/nickel transport system permease protein